MVVSIQIQLENLKFSFECKSHHTTTLQNCGSSNVQIRILLFKVPGSFHLILISVFMVTSE